MGGEGIEGKVEIEKGVSEVGEVKGELGNGEYVVEELRKGNMKDVNFRGFKYELRG